VGFNAFCLSYRSMDIRLFLKKHNVVSIDLKKYGNVTIDRMNRIIGGMIEPIYDHPTLSRLAGLYFALEKKYDQAERYYQMAIKQGDSDAHNNLGLMYFVQKKYDQAERYYLMAIDQGCSIASNNLGLMYSEQKKYDLSERYFLMAIDQGVDQAIIGLKSIYPDDLKLYNILTKLTKNDLIEKTMRELEIDQQIRYFKNKKDSLSKKAECPICYEELMLIPRECAHYYCPDCYVRIDRCAFGCDND
jgi:tetratricopeptide (TPR) repeat protein